MKNFWAFIIYGIKIRQVNIIAVTIDTILIFYAIINYKELTQTKNIALLLFLIFTNFLWQIYCLYKDLSFLKRTDDYRTQNQTKHLDFKINTRTKELYPDKPLNFCGHTVICNSEFNTLLQSSTPIKSIKSEEKKEKVESYIKRYKSQLLPFLNCKYHEMKTNKGGFFNETKLCMGSEFFKSGDNYAVLLNKGYYYNTYLTNFIYTQTLSHQSGFSLEPPANIHNYPIAPLKKSVMSDHIGVSTLAVTRDGYAIILKHNNKALSYADCLVPSGSGSVDYHDLKTDQDFRQTIISAAEREFHEETRIPIETIDQTKVIGFYRDLNRGGKPEFCCITQLKSHLHELSVKPNKSEQRDDFEEFRIFDEDGNPNEQEFSKLTELNSDHNYNSNQISLSLHMNLTMLYKYKSKKINLKEI